MRRGDPLPAIDVYRVGEVHFVRDGHHRVSVARALGHNERRCPAGSPARRSRARRGAPAPPPPPRRAGSGEDPRGHAPPSGPALPPAGAQEVVGGVGTGRSGGTHGHMVSPALPWLQA
jgi:hypothetical protein